MRTLDAYIIAKKHGRGHDFIEAFAELVWGRGYDVGSDRGLREVVERAGVSWKEVKGVLGDELIEKEWREMTTIHREEVSSLGHWGVPCVRVCSSKRVAVAVANSKNNVTREEAEVIEKQEDNIDEVFVWGQDKLWVVENFIQRLI